MIGMFRKYGSNGNKWLAYRLSVCTRVVEGSTIQESVKIQLNIKKKMVNKVGVKRQVSADNGSADEMLSLVPTVAIWVQL